MAIKTIDEIKTALSVLLRNDAAAASIQPEEVKSIVVDIVDTNENEINNTLIVGRNARDMAQQAQSDATKALSDIHAVNEIANNANNLAVETKVLSDQNKIDIATNKTNITTNNQIAKEGRATANSAYDRTSSILQRLVGIDNDITELNEGGDTADWALTENTDLIPENKLGNAVDQIARSSASNALNIAGVNSTIINALPIFATTTLSPSGVRGTDLPKYIALELANKIARRNIAQVEVYTQGQLLTRVNNVTSASVINQLNSHGGLINIEIGNDIIETISNNLQSSIQDLRFLVQYKFEGTNLGTGTQPDQIDEVHFGVNNDSFLRQPELIGTANFNITARNVFSSGALEIILPRIGFGLINMGRRASNQATDLSHHIINFEMITALTASNHGSAATDINTFGFVSSNRNYRIGRTNGNRLLIASDGGSTDSIPATLYRY